MMLLRLAPVALGTLIAPLDSAVNVAFPAMVAAFSLDVSGIQWVVISYVLTYGSLMLAVGRLGDIFGHARVFRAGLVWSAAALALLSLLPGFGALLAGRVLQGVGAALVLGCGPALATQLVPDTMRARALGAYAATLAAGSTIGPMIGGLLVQQFGWQSVYWFRVPIALAALVLANGLADPQRPDRREPFDAVGAALLVLAISCLLLAMNRGAAWPFILSLASGGAFVWRSVRAPRPIIDLGLFRKPGFAALNLANALVAFAGFSVLLLVPFYLARIVGLPPGPLGFVLATGPAGGVAGAWIGGCLATRYGAVALMMAGAALTTVGLLAVAAWQAATPIVLIVAALLIQGLGVGLFTLAYTDRVTATMRRQDRGVAGSLTMLTRTLGVVAAASLLAMVFGTAEDASLAAGQTPQSAFMGAFSRAFLVASAASLLAIPLLRER